MHERKKIQQREEGKVTIIYLGPEIPGVVAAGAVFKNGLTEKLKESVEELQAIHRLLVPVKDVVKMKKELSKEASAARICFKIVAEYAARKGVSKA